MDIELMVLTIWVILYNIIAFWMLFHTVKHLLRKYFDVDRIIGWFKKQAAAARGAAARYNNRKGE